jgi:hypothetical protein
MFGPQWGILVRPVAQPVATVYARLGSMSGGQALQAIMDRSSMNLADRSTAYRNAGWKSFDPRAAPYTADQVRTERDLYR